MDTAGLDLVKMHVSTFCLPKEEEIFLRGWSSELEKCRQTCNCLFTIPAMATQPPLMDTANRTGIYLGSKTLFLGNSHEGSPAQEKSGFLSFAWPSPGKAGQQYDNIPLPFGFLSFLPTLSFWLLWCGPGWLLRVGCWWNFPPTLISWTFHQICCYCVVVVIVVFVNGICTISYKLALFDRANDFRAFTYCCFQ